MEGNASKALGKSNLYFASSGRYDQAMKTLRRPRPPASLEPRPAGRPPVGVCIMAGGQSSRMGRDKASLRLGGRTFITAIRQTAAVLRCRVRVIRRDLWPGNGPLGGIHTGLKTSRAEAEVFLACDMPFITPDLLRELLARLGPRHDAVFAVSASPEPAAEGACPELVEGRQMAGFPFVVRSALWPIVEGRLAAGELGLQGLARALRARRWAVPARWRNQLRNINTPEDFALAQPLRGWASAKCGAKISAARL
jgi:molybdopterin-guanine dinucleotide biosynthesis protein A